MVWKVPNNNRKTRDLSENLAQISPRKIIRELKRTLKTCMISRSLLRTGENKIVRTQSFKTMPASWKIILRQLVRLVFKTSRCLMCKKVLYPCNKEEITTLIWETKSLLKSCLQNQFNRRRLYWLNPQFFRRVRRNLHKLACRLLLKSLIFRRPCLWQLT